VETANVLGLAGEGLRVAGWLSARRRPWNAGSPLFAREPPNWNSPPLGSDRCGNNCTTGLPRSDKSREAARTIASNMNRNTVRHCLCPLHRPWYLYGGAVMSAPNC